MHSSSAFPAVAPASVAPAVASAVSAASGSAAPVSAPVAPTCDSEHVRDGVYRSDGRHGACWWAGAE